jgi:restriction system protein
MWMVRAGKGGYVAKDFRNANTVAIGWDELGDLTTVRTKPELRSLYTATYPHEGPGTVANAVGVIHKFRSILKVGDEVVTYDPENREYLIGRIASDYLFRPGRVRDHGHVREVSWQGVVSRDKLRVASRNSLGSILTLFSINREVADELKEVLSGKAPIPESESFEEEREELSQIKEEMAERAHELLKDKILLLDADHMEQLVAAVLRAMGYRTKVSPKGRDRGVDVVASPDGLGLQEPRIKVEVKHRSETKMGGPELRNFLGALRPGDRGLYVSTGGFTEDAKYEAERAVHPISLVDLDEFAQLVVNHYERFDNEGRVLLPMVKIYWPAD